MKLYSGIDVVSVERVRRLIAEFGDRFLKKVFPEGVNYCLEKRKGELAGCIAARFALKEAAVKALSSAGLEVGLKDVKVKGGGRKLRVKLPEGLEGRFSTSYSISHERDLAVAVFILLEENSCHDP